MNEKYTYQLQITTSIQGKELSEIARQVAEILSNSQWIKGTANIFLANPDSNAIETAVKLAGGEKFNVTLLLDILRTVTISVGGQLVFDSTQAAGANHLFMPVQQLPPLQVGE